VVENQLLHGEKSFHGPRVVRTGFALLKTEYLVFHVEAFVLSELGFMG
jgi:hypothetical protein